MVLASGLDAPSSAARAWKAEVVAPPKKQLPSSADGSGGKSKAALAGLTAVVVKQLKDPKVRKQVIDQGLAIAALAQTWRGERRKDPTQKRSNPLAGRFGQEKLERRVEHLQTSVAELATTRPALTEVLEPISTTLGEIDSALSIAGGLPFAKRKKAHLQIGQALDRLEETIFEASMPKSI